MASKKKSTNITNDDMKMKVVIIVALIVAFIGGFLIARAKYKPQLVELTNMISDKDAAMQQMRSNENKIQKKEGKMWIIENGMAKEITTEVVLVNGDKVMVDGTVIKSDGTSTKLTDGESLDMNGNLVSNGGDSMH